MFVNMDDHRKDGQLNWDSYRKAQIENGEYCYKCNTHMIFGGNGYRKCCNSCNDLYKKSSIDHKKFIRCPACNHTFPVFESGYYELMTEGEHEVSCEECGYDFMVETTIQYNFRSPDLIEEESESEEEFVEE